LGEDLGLYDDKKEKKFLKDRIEAAAKAKREAIMMKSMGRSVSSAMSLHIVK